MLGAHTRHRPTQHAIEQRRLEASLMRHGSTVTGDKGRSQSTVCEAGEQS